MVDVVLPGSPNVRARLRVVVRTDGVCLLHALIYYLTRKRTNTCVYREHRRRYIEDEKKDITEDIGRYMLDDVCLIATSHSNNLHKKQFLIFA